MWGRSMRTPQVNGHEPPATPVYHHSNMRTPAVHGHESGYPSATPASYGALNGSAGPRATPSQVAFLRLSNCHLSGSALLAQGHQRVKSKLKL